MKLLAVFASLVIVQAGVIPEICNGIEIKGALYEKEILVQELDRPYLLAVDYSTNILYFSHSLHKEEDLFTSSYYNLNNKEFANINDIPNGFAQAVDEKNHDVYIGGTDGIYKFNHNTKTSEYYGGTHLNIWNLFFKDVLYYTTFPNQFLYTTINNETKRYTDLEDTKVDQFIIDNENDIFYTNDTGLFKQTKGTKDAELYHEKVEFRGLATDINGKAYVCIQNGVFKVNKKEKKLEKIIDIEDAFGLAFDNENNVIYSDAVSVVRLKPKESCNVTNDVNVENDKEQNL